MSEKTMAFPLILENEEAIDKITSWLSRSDSRAFGMRSSEYHRSSAVILIEYLNHTPKVDEDSEWLKILIIKRWFKKHYYFDQHQDNEVVGSLSIELYR